MEAQVSAAGDLGITRGTWVASGKKKGGDAYRLTGYYVDRMAETAERFIQIHAGYSAARTSRRSKKHRCTMALALFNATDCTKQRQCVASSTMSRMIVLRS